MRARYQLAIGIGSAVVSMAIGLLVVPVYIRLLGLEAYGLAGFLLLLQGMLQILDLGLAPTTSREVARGFAIGDFSEARGLVASLARLYAITSIVIGLTVIILSVPIATGWLTPVTLTRDTVVNAVMLIGVILAVRWPVGIYSGVLIGAHRLTAVSIVTVIFNAGASLSVLPLLWWIPRVETLFAWQALAGLAQLLILRHLAWRAIGGRHGAAPSLAVLRNVWRFSAGMSGVTLSAVMLQQLDKLFISKFVSLQAFGLYSLAVLLGRALYSLINPIYNLIYPRFTAMIASGNEGALSQAYRYWTTMFCCLFFPASMMIAIGAEPLLRVWTHDAALSLTAAPLVTLIVISAALHGVMYFPFALQVAAGDSRTPLTVNLVLLALYAPLLLLLLMTSGVIGAAWAAVVLFGFYLLFGTWATHRRILPRLGTPWLTKEVLPPLVVTTAIGMVGRLALHQLPVSLADQFGVIAASGFVATALCLALAARHSELRREMRQFIRRATGTV